ncbi:MAG: type IV secretion system DNA-binding domain-containing protein [Betaproteobacteria bacterium]|nr:type IV secretion system DNA-binding domain-containing protein [Betaproteobacteria bacterium]
MPQSRQILLQGNGAYPELTRAYVEGIFSVISGIVNSVELDDDPKRKIWIVADEFAQMGKIPVRPLFEVGRSRGVRCIVACQDFAQLEEVHGKEGTRALISMCGTLMVGRVGPGETAETLSKNLGTREVERTNLSVSFDGKAGASGPTTTQTYSRDSLALYVPAELAARLGEKPHLKGCVFAVAVQGKTYEVLWPYFNMPKHRKAHVPAPWTRGIPRTPEPAGAMQVIPATRVRTATKTVELKQPDGKQEATATQRTEPAFVPHTPSRSPTAMPKPSNSQHKQRLQPPPTPHRTHRNTSPPAQSRTFDPVATIAEIGLSPHPTETATHLVLRRLNSCDPVRVPSRRDHPGAGGRFLSPPPPPPPSPPRGGGGEGG